MQEEISSFDDMGQKEINKQSAEVIHTFATGIDPKNKNYYNNKTQISASKFLIQEYGFEQTINLIKALPKLKTIPYMPSITTPCELRDKWQKVSDCILRYKSNKENEYREVVW